MAETLVKVPGRQRLWRLVRQCRGDFALGGTSVAVRLVGGVQTSCWVLKQPALLVGLVDPLLVSIPLTGL